MENKKKIRKYLAIFFFILVIFVIYNIYHILSPFLICALLIYLLAPIVNWLSSKSFGNYKLTRGYSVVIVYIVILSLLILGGTVLFPIMYAEGKKIASEIPAQINSFRTETLPVWIGAIQEQISSFGIDVNIQQEFDKMIESAMSTGEGHLESIPKYAQKIASGFFSTMTSLVVIFIFTAFVLIDLPSLKKNIINLIPLEYRESARDLANAINKDMNGAIRGQLIICIVNGFLSTLGLLILKVKFAVTLGIIAAIFSLIPIFGTIFSLAPTVMVAITQSWLLALEVIVLILLIHLIEANLLNPKIMGTSVELHPAIIIFSIFVGEHLFGIAGLLLAVPLIAAVRSVLIYTYKKYFIDNESSTLTIVE
ncbi:MAG: AI-2E family transporter [Candidatus Sericytochromatia bacterium]